MIVAVERWVFRLLCVVSPRMTSHGVCSWGTLNLLATNDAYMRPETEFHDVTSGWEIGSVLAERMGQGEVGVCTRKDKQHGHVWLAMS